MFGLEMLDIGIGLIFVYLLLSIVCTAVKELISSRLKLRAKNLEKGIHNLLKEKGIPDLENKFYDHPLVKSLHRTGSKPSYIPPRIFAMTLLDLLPSGKGGDGVEARIEALDDSDLQRTLRLFMNDVAGDMKLMQSNIETWFNHSMERVSGWYKRQTQVIVLLLAIGVTVAANADTFQIARSIANDPAVRQVLVVEAQEFSRQQKGASPGSAVKETRQTMDQLGIPLGWRSPYPEGPREWFNKIIGLLITALAVSLGSPFWFDILKKTGSIRSTGASPVEQKKEQ